MRPMVCPIDSVALAQDYFDCLCFCGAPYACMETLAIPREGVETHEISRRQVAGANSGNIKIRSCSTGGTTSGLKTYI